MYDIRNLNIWKESSEYSFLKSREKVLEVDVSKRKETSMSDKCMKIFEEMFLLFPTADFSGIWNCQGGKFKFPMYVNEKLMTTDLEALDLSTRSNNCLHRAGYRTIGELVEAINGREDLEKIRNCGAKSIDEIMEQLFCYQYSQLSQERKVKFLKRVLELN